MIANAGNSSALCEKRTFPTKSKIKRNVKRREELRGQTSRSLEMRNAGWSEDSKAKEVSKTQRSAMPVCCRWISSLIICSRNFSLTLVQHDVMRGRRIYQPRNIRMKDTRNANTVLLQSSKLWRPYGINSRYVQGTSNIVVASISFLHVSSSPLIRIEPPTTTHPVSFND